MSLAKHTPIILQYTQAVIRDSDGALNNVADVGSYTMRIAAPLSVAPGVRQSLPTETIIRIPPSGLVKIRLIPSSHYYPAGRYKIAFFTPGIKFPVAEQLWVVPEAPGSHRYTLAAMGGQLVIPDNPRPAYSAEVINWEGEVSIEGNIITWLSNPPPDGQEVQVDVEQAVTLSELIEPIAVVAQSFPVQQRNLFRDVWI